MATIILIDPDTGVQTALIDATALTDMRTGAAGALLRISCTEEAADV
jgi:Predicted ornithine cyclodeaminase, mu-crystallin homolog